MTRALSTILAGWLLVNSYGGTIAWYETKEDCDFANEYADSAQCVPDRFAVEELRKAKP